MKKICSIILLGTLLASIPTPVFAETVQKNASAQVSDGPKNEISASYGAVTLLQFANGFAGIFITAFSGGHFMLEGLQANGSINLSYYRHINDWLSLGADLAGETVTMTFKAKDLGTKTQNTTLALSPMLTVKGNWLRRDHFCLYSRISAGAMLMKNPVESTVKSTFSAQVSPVAAEFGGIALRGFVEAGIGDQGCAILGLRYRF